MMVITKSEISVFCIATPLPTPKMFSMWYFCKHDACILQGTKEYLLYWGGEYICVSLSLGERNGMSVGKATSLMQRENWSDRCSVRGAWRLEPQGCHAEPGASVGTLTLFPFFTVKWVESPHRHRMVTGKECIVVLIRVSFTGWEFSQGELNVFRKYHIILLSW